jgi:hypothetical protein
LGFTLLDKAIKYKHPEIIELLILSGGEQAHSTLSLPLLQHIHTQNTKRPKTTYYLAGQHLYLNNDIDNKHQ